MPRIYSGDPDREFQRLRREGRAGLPRDPLRQAVERREMLNTARFGSFADDVANLEGQISRGRQLLESRGFRDLSQKNLATAGPENIEAIGDMRRRRANTVSGGGMGNSQVAWPKFRDPFEQFREKAWWFLKEGEFSQSLKKVREWTRLMYMTHPLVPSLIDIYARFPLLDIEFKHQDKKLCTPAETPIWMGDYSFKPISEVVVGDEVIGWDRSDGKAKLKRVKVTNTYRYENQKVIKATLDSGRIIRCTPEHKWANYLYSPGRKKSSISASFKELESRRIASAKLFEQGVPQKEIAERLDASPAAVSLWHKAWKLGGEAALSSRFVVNRSGTEQRYAEWTTAFVGAKLKHVVDPTPELTSEKERLVAAWLGGIYDGEGSGKWIAQSHSHNPDVYERIINSLEFLGFRTYESRQKHNIGFHQARDSYGIHRSRQELTDFLNWTNPTRRIRKQTDSRLLAGNWGAEDLIVSIEDDGYETVYAIETESNNYVAWGFASSNSDFYNDLFLNELNYQDFLYDMSKEFWTVGEAFALGSWHEGIGAWDDDELINPDDVIVSRNSVLRQYQFHLKVPEGIKKLIETRQPRQEYEMLVKFYPYILQWAQQNREIPVSDVLMKQLKFKVNPWEPHGVPILMRGFKVLMLEMSLEAAQDAVADRLYSPLILAKLGIEDIADGEGPWIPEPEELDALRDDLSLALMSDFRLMVYHHGLQIESVFGRENMPRLDYDFDRIDMKLMQIFGIGPELLQGGKSSAPYASGALNRELITQMLSTYQNNIKRFIQSRAEVVAERQGHFEFEKRGGQRFPIYETTLMLDEETGEEYIEERPKLAVPEVSFRTMNLRDEMTERQFLMQLRQSGIPISDESLMVNIPFEFEDEVLKLEREKADKVIAELNYQKRLFTSMYLNRLPIPPEYYQAYVQFLSGIQGIALASGGTDITSGSPTPNLFPMMQPTQGDMNNAMMVEQMAAEEMLEMPMYRPAISDEQRGDMPKSSSIRMYATAEEVEESNRIGFDAFVAKLGAINSDTKPESSPETLDIDDDEPLPWHQASPVVEPSDESNARRVDGIKSMASPGHMRLRKKMTLPSAIRYSQAPDIQEEKPSDSERPVERESSVLDDGNESDG